MLIRATCARITKLDEEEEGTSEVIRNKNGMRKGRSGKVALNGILCARHA